MTTQTKTIQKYEIIDHGIDGASYFQGCGISLTEYSDVATGIGENAQEALDDALDSLAQNDWDVSQISLKTQGIGDPDDTVSAYIAKYDESGDEKTDSDHDLHYYVSVRVA